MGVMWRVCVWVGMVVGVAAPSWVCHGFELTAFDVDQGEALRIRWQEDCLWVDFGTKFSAQMRANLFLSEKQVCKKSAYVITHSDADHSGGLSFLRPLLGIATLKIPWMPRMEKLWPPEGYVSKHDNDQSWVLRVWDESYKHCALLTADITQRVEQVLIQQPHWKSCEILKVAHHGSKTSTSSAFLHALRPKVALISAGWKNTYGHPHPSVLKRLRDQGVLTFRTDIHGQIRVRIEDQSLSVTTPRGRVVLPLL